MRSLVVYFSITGNTKKIAEAIHKGMSYTGESCDIAKMRDVISLNLKNYDLIGVGGPVMHLREPAIVEDFVEYSMRHAEGKHAFAFCTHGALPAHYLSRVVPAMIQNGVTVIGWNDWFGGVCHPVRPKPYFTDGHPDETDLREAEEFGKEMMERSRRISNGETHLIPKFPMGKEYDEIYNPPELKMETKEAREQRAKVRNAQAVDFIVNMEKCKYPQCTFCIDNCPMKVVDFAVSPPVFNVYCDKCWICEQACPEGAIEVDYSRFQDILEAKPGESLEEKALEIFEVRGRFRRLVPPEKIGWDTPFQTVKKPRYKLP